MLLYQDLALVKVVKPNFKSYIINKSKDYQDDNYYSKKYGFNLKSKSKKCIDFSFTIKIV